MHGQRAATFIFVGMVEVRETPERLLLFPQPKRAFFIPVHAFQRPEDLETVREFIRAKKLKYEHL